MAQPLKTPKTIVVSSVIDVIFKVLIGVALVILSWTTYQQREERDCFFHLTTETDRIDSDIETKQAEIFAAAIRNAGNPNGPSPEVIRLGEELEELIVDRDAAYERREDASRRCD